MKTWNNWRLAKEEKGNTLILVLIVILLFSSIGLSMIQSSLNSVSLSDGEVKEQSAYYIAESGITYTLDQIQQALDEVEDLNKITDEQYYNYVNANILTGTQPRVFSSFEKQKGIQPMAMVTVKMSNVSSDRTVRDYIITSTGQVGERKKTLQTSYSLDLERKPGPTLPSNLGIYSKGKMKLANGVVTGNILLESNAQNMLEVTGNPTINGAVYTLPSSHSKTILAPNWWLDQKRPIIYKEDFNLGLTLPDFPSANDFNYKIIPDTTFKAGSSQYQVISKGNINISNWIVSDYELILDQDYKVNDINLSSNYRLTINVKDKDVSLYVNSIQGIGHLDVKSQPGGSLTIYLADNISLNGHVNESDGNDLFIYIGPSNGQTKLVKSSGYGKFNASIYAKDANLEFVGSASLNGSILSGGQNVKVTGATQINAPKKLIFAPNAHVEIIEGGTVNGGIVSDTFTISGGAKVNAASIELDDLPFFGEASSETNLIVKKGTVREITNP